MWIRYKVTAKSGESERLVNFSEVGTMTFVDNKITIDDEWINPSEEGYEDNLIVFQDCARASDVWEFFCSALADGRKFFDFLPHQEGE